MTCVQFVIQNSDPQNDNHSMFVWPSLFKGMGGRVYVRSCQPMDKFREVRGQSLCRRGTPACRAKCLADSTWTVSKSTLKCWFFIFVCGWLAGFVSAVVYLINFELH